MIRLPLAAAFAAGLLWVATGTAPAQDAKSGVSPQTDKINELIAKGWEIEGHQEAGGPGKGPGVHAAGLHRPDRPHPDSRGNRRLRGERRQQAGTAGLPPPERDFLYPQGQRRPGAHGDSGAAVLQDRREGPEWQGSRRRGINYNDAYAENFAELWTTWMLTRSNTHPIYREQFHIWLTQQFARPSQNARTDYPDGKPWNKIVYEVDQREREVERERSGRLRDPPPRRPDRRRDGSARPNFNKEGKFDAVPITSRVTKLFLGIQTQCVQCHDHPFNKEYVQSDFWGVNAFFRQTDRSGTTNPRNLAPAASRRRSSTLSDVDRLEPTGHGALRAPRRAAEGVVSRRCSRTSPSSRSGDVDEQAPVSGAFREPRARSAAQMLAEWVTEHDNFAKAFVNRMWGHLFGRGLNKEPAVDDFSSDNEVVHPELLDYLAEEFKKYNYDPKKLLEWICTSDAYNLSHVASKEYADPKYDPYFARMPLKAMSPEVLFESLRSRPGPRRARTTSSTTALEDRLEPEADRRTSATTRGTRSASTAPSCRRC